jgi:hypothetical protein
MTDTPRFYIDLAGDTCLVLDRTRKRDPIECGNLLEARKLAELVNLTPEKFAEVLEGAWSGEYVVESFLKSMALTLELIEATDPGKKHKDDVLRAHMIITHAGAVGIFRDEFLRRILPDHLDIESLNEVTRIGMIHSQLENLWENWKGEPDA